MELKRNVYGDLLDWKDADAGRVLILEGAVQVGKTHILKKFGKENYKNDFYVNMVDKTGEDFLACIKAAERTPGSGKRSERPMHDALRMYAPNFVDDKETVVIIDEIQEDEEVYGRIRRFAGELSCHFIVAMSYPGRIHGKGCLHPVEDVDVLKMETLGFDEFLGALGKRGLYESADPYGGSDPESYMELRECYESYSQIGGYPTVVREYLKTGDLRDCEREIRKVAQTFLLESKARFMDVVEHSVLAAALPAVARAAIAGKDPFAEIAKAARHTGGKRTARKALDWLHSSNIIGYADGSRLEVATGGRAFYTDVGLARHFVRTVGCPPEDCDRAVDLNFAYLAIRRRAAEGDSKSARPLLEDGRLDRPYRLRRDAEWGALKDGIWTVPLYLADKVAFTGVGLKNTTIIETVDR